MKDYPVIKLTLYLIIGIIGGKLFPLEICLLTFGIFLFLLLISTLPFYLKHLKKLRFVSSNFFIPLLIVFIGAISFSVAQSDKPDYPFDNTRLRNTTVIGQVKSIELIRKNSFRLKLETEEIICKDSIAKTGLNILCKVKDKNPKKLMQLFSELKIGNRVKIIGTLYKANDKRNPGDFDYNHYLKQKGISALFSVQHSNNISVISSEIDYFANSVFTLRKNINSIIERLYAPKAAALLRGLLLADRGEIESQTKTYFVNAGVVHVLAVSGLHVGFIVLIVLTLLSRFNIFVRYVLTIFAVIFFMILTNGPPSVVRASIMAIILIVSILSNRQYNALNSLALAAFIILIFAPAQLFQPGFELSFSAVLSIIILFPIFRKWLTDIGIENKILKWLLLFISVSFTAQIGTLPFTLAFFHKLSIAALFANLFVIPLIGVIVALGILTTVIGVAPNIIAVIYAAANNLIIDILFSFVSYIGSLNYSYLNIINFTFYDSIIYYTVLIMLIYFFGKFVHLRAKLMLMLLLFCNAIVLLPLDNESLLAEGKLSIMAIDIGQGDGFLIKFPNGKTAMVDAGNATPYRDNGRVVIEPVLKYAGISKINYGFVSHIDADHYKGYLSLIKDGFVDTVFKPILDPNLGKDVRFENFVSAKSIPIKYYSHQKIMVGNCRVYILNDTTDTSFLPKDTNDKSGIIKIVYGNFSVLFVGDAEKRTEKYYISKYGNFLKSSILKVGHHGSKSSSSFQFLSKVKPEYGIISVGLHNKFHHPSPSVIERLNQMKIKIHRTDREGAVIFQSDGTSYKFIDWK